VSDDRLLLRGESDDGVAAYKASARARIESIYDVVIIANIGDQDSDLDGGFAERHFKVPNPFYFIPKRPQP